MFVLFHLIALAIVSVIDTALFGVPVVLYPIYVLGTLLPTLAVSVRRLHDTGRSGWWMLFNVVPFGTIVVLIFELMDSAPGDNAYGPNPKGIQA